MVLAAHLRHTSIIEQRQRDDSNCWALFQIDSVVYGFEFIIIQTTCESAKTQLHDLLSVGWTCVRLPNSGASWQHKCAFCEESTNIGALVDYPILN